MISLRYISNANLSIISFVNSDANIFIPPGEGATLNNRRQLGVMISWRENERTELDATDRQNTDATQVRANDGTFSAGAGSAASCPALRSWRIGSSSRTVLTPRFALTVTGTISSAK